jgi:hypothetical protein
VGLLDCCRHLLRTLCLLFVCCLLLLLLLLLRETHIWHWAEAPLKRPSQGRRRLAAAVISWPAS